MRSMVGGRAASEPFAASLLHRLVAVVSLSLPGRIDDAPTAPSRNKSATNPPPCRLPVSASTC